MRGAADRLEREHQGRAWLAWHAAHLPKMRIQSLKQLLEPSSPPAAALGAAASWQDRAAQWQVLAENSR